MIETDALYTIPFKLSRKILNSPVTRRKPHFLSGVKNPIYDPAGIVVYFRVTAGYSIRATATASRFKLGAL